ncbi:lipopolysaccharide biosynthesis protein [Polaribacter sp. AHE13PA]|uniref:lipopolysaccharide biosynthesis protein n=2 Tax=Polaribacter TaxID=52959 RepID=UPI001C4EF779|nr:lipopolysaccharide biosynthesis protein [Polaribacter sp. AHE13PA]QXP67972.1 lipopolysaccharide biosynthesis protein [Polaribacter sp. AHE13PA]
MTSLKKKSLTGLVWDFVGKLGLQGVGFFVSIILARILLPEDFGLLAIITVFINLANVFLDFGFSTALVQRTNVTNEHYASVFFMNVIMGVFLGGLVFFTAPLVANFYEKEVLTNLIRVMSFSFVINSFGNVTRAYLRRIMNFKIISVSNIISAFISGFIAVYMAYNGYGVWSLVVQILISEILNNILIFVLSKFRFKLVFSLNAVKELWGFGSKIFLTGVLDTIFINLDSLIIGKILNPATLGYYYRSKSLENFSFRYTASTLSNILLPSLSTINNEPIVYKNTVLKLFKIISFVSFLACGVFLVGAHEIILLLFSDKWEPSVRIFQIIIFGAFAPQIFNLFYNILLSKGLSGLYLKINVFSKILFFANFIFLFYGNLNSYLIGFVCAQIIVFFTGLIVISEKLNFKNELYYISIKNMVIYLVSILIIFGLKQYVYLQILHIDLLISSITFLIVFLTFYFVFMKKDLILMVKEIKEVLNIKNG